MEQLETQAGGTELQNFKAMIEGAEKLIKPWRLALILTNLFWAIALTSFIFFAYLSPAEMEQKQDLPVQQQEQTYKGVR